MNYLFLVPAPASTTSSTSSSSSGSIGHVTSCPLSSQTTEATPEEDNTVEFRRHLEQMGGCE